MLVLGKVVYRMTCSALSNSCCNSLLWNHVVAVIRKNRSGPFCSMTDFTGHIIISPSPSFVWFVGKNVCSIGASDSAIQGQLLFLYRTCNCLDKRILLHISVVIRRYMSFIDENFDKYFLFGSFKMWGSYWKASFKWSFKCNINSQVDLRKCQLQCYCYSRTCYSTIHVTVEQAFVTSTLWGPGKVMFTFQSPVLFLWFSIFWSSCVYRDKSILAVQVVLYLCWLAASSDM